MKQLKFNATRTFAALLCAALLVTANSPILADDKVYTLRIQTHFGPDQLSGKLASQFVEDVELMANGQLNIEMFYSSSVVKSVETFDAAATGIIDGDMTTGAYQTSKDPAFQFVGDIVGAYDTPYQQHAWFYNGGQDIAQKLYNKYGMELIGWWIPGPEAMSSASPLAGPEDLKNWKFRSPPGLGTKVFEAMGADPVVMSFTEIFSALQSKTLDGTDASSLSSNVMLGLYDLVKHATYPGFHSMPSDHLAINKSKWDALPEHLQRIIQVAMQKLAFQTAITFDVKNREAAAKLTASGVTLHDWPQADRRAFRETAQGAWSEFAEGSAQAEELVESHKLFTRKLGLLEE